MSPNSHFSADLVIFTEEILNGKLIFFIFAVFNRYAGPLFEKSSEESPCFTQ